MEVQMCNANRKFVDLLQEIMTISSKSCKSLKFLEEPSPQINSNNGLPVSNKYCMRSLRADQLRESNIIKNKWNDNILQYSQRNLAVGRGSDVIYDLPKIEHQLAHWLVFDKVYIETISNSQLYFEPFSYHMELFQGSARILNYIKNIIPQEPIPIEKISQFMNNLDDTREILSSLEVLLCFVKLNAVGQEDMLIQNYVTR